MVTSATFAALGPIYFLGSNTIAQILHPKENPIGVTVSFLVFGSYGWLQTSAFYILGFSLLALAVALVLKINAKLNLGAVVVFLTGIAFILVAGNHVQNAGTTITTSEIIHRDSAIAIVAMSPLACFLLAPSLKASGHTGLCLYSIGAGCIAVFDYCPWFTDSNRTFLLPWHLRTYFALQRSTLGRNNLCSFNVGRFQDETYSRRRY